MEASHIEDSYPLSPMQQGMLFHSLYARQPGVDIEQMVCCLHEGLETSAFKRAWQRVVERHPILRTGFRWQNLTEPIQEVHQAVTLPIEEFDWRAESPADQERLLGEFLQTDRRRGFDFSAVPLLRLTLLHVADADYKCVWTFHHILLDGRSFPAVLNEVFAFYEAFREGREIDLERPRPYRDYIDWLQTPDQSEAEAFWRATLKGFAATTEVRTPTPVARIDANDNHFEQQTRLTAATTTALRSLALKEQLTFNTIIQGAWALLLSRYSGEGDVVFGATRACRRSAVEGAEGMVGLFINTLPLRVTVPSDVELLPWLKEVRARHNELRDYEHSPLVKIQGWSEVPRGTQLFESILVFENYEMNAALRSQGGNWERREFHLYEQTSYPLTVAVYLESELLLKIAYDRRRFDDTTIARMLGHLQTLLEGMAAHPERRLSTLPLLTEAEQHQLLAEWNDTAVEYPKHRCIHQLFEEQADRVPDAVAAVFRGRQFTYGELNRHANQLAHYLKKRGVGPEKIVGLCAERSLEMLVGLLGILKAGGAYVPLDPSYPAERLAFMLKDSGVALLVTQQSLVARLPKLAEVVCLDTDWTAIARESEENPASGVTGENLAYVIYTSGSTGRPKGVLIAHQALVNHSIAVAEHYGLKASDRIVQFASISFDVAAEELYPTWLSGATLVLPPEQPPLSLSDFLRFTEREDLTVLNLPTPYWAALVSELAAGSSLPASIRLVVAGSEKALTEHLSVWRQLVGDRVRWINAYGPTEATITALTYEPAIQQDHRAVSIVPIGRPIANTQAYILDACLRLAPIGVPGELHISGAGLARGYLRRPELTAEKFIPHPFSDLPGARLYKTGDLVRYLPDGNIEFLGRVDDQVKIRGFRIELGEIESVLATHAAVHECVVVACDNTDSVEQRLVAYVVAPKSPKVSGDDLRRFLTGKLPAYMVPSTFVMLQALPTLPNGKVNRRALPVPVDEQSEVREGFVSARDASEMYVVKLWERLLGKQPIGIHDNFFDLGGHSLIALRMFGEIEQQFGKSLPLTTLFHAPTVEKLCRLLREEGTQEPWSSLVPIQTEGTKPPLFCIHAAGGNVLFYRPLIRRLAPDQPFYGLQTQGLDGKRPHHTSIEDMAAHYISEIRRVEPRGPYFLGGASFGGLVAFEMARQLEASGQRVALIALFDTHGPGYPRLLPTTSAFAAKVISYRERIENHASNLALLDWQGRLTYVREKRRKAVVKFIRGFKDKRGRIARKLHLSPLNPLPTKLQEAQNSIMQCVRDYVPQVYTGKVTLFRASKQPSGIYPDPELGWGGLAAGGLVIHDVPGLHGSMMTEPRVQILAKKLTECLSMAQAASEFVEPQSTEPELDHSRLAVSDLEGRQLVPWASVMHR